MTSDETHDDVTCAPHRATSHRFALGFLFQIERDRNG